MGHFYNAYQISHIGVKALRNTGLSKNKSYLWGGMLGFLVLTPIEVLDGFSAEYGASWGDLIANFSGSALLTSQYLLWDEIKIHPKYSFLPNDIAKERPEVLGSGFQEEIIKNYNGMTFWLSFDVHGLAQKPNHFPKWLNIAIGYGGENMISADDHMSRLSGYDPYRQYFISIDVDLTYVQTNSKILKGLFYMVNMIHIPAPALEYNRKDGFVFHPLYF